MSTKNPLPQNIKQWLNDREISDDVLNMYDIGWDQNNFQIIIPIHNREGKEIFYKFRRNPFSTEGPKYKYQQGASSAIYGLKTLNIKNNNRLFIVEGELDCLCLISKGYQTITSTGGASTFKKEWADYLSKLEDLEVYICLDTDKAGIDGAIKIHSMIRGSRIIELPKECKDVTEYFVKLKKTHNDFEKLILEARGYVFPTDWKEAKTKKELNAKEKEYKEKINPLMEEAREIRSQYKSDKYIQKVIDMYMNRLAEVKRAIKYFQIKREDINNNRLESAKKVPIPQFIKFDREDNACCIFHNERTPSMHYYEKNNKVKCFGCGKTADVIDVVQEINKCSLVDALKIILGN